MGKLKQISLDHRGYEIRGEVLIKAWGGAIGTVSMTPVFIPALKLTHNAIKRSVNDGGFGCERIEQATVMIYDVYGFTPAYKQFNRVIELDFLQCREAFTG
jgi:hypothetical protein